MLRGEIMTTAALIDEHALSPAQERATAAELSPDIAWPTLALAIAAPLSMGALIAAGVTGTAPLWACAIALAPISYAHYTIVHECVHGNIVPGAPRVRWLHEVFGWIGALGMSYPYPLLRRSHLLHHAHTNTVDDPDISVRGSFAALIMKWVALSVISVLPAWLGRRLRPELRAYASPLTKGELLRVDIVTTILAFVPIACALSGWMAHWTLLWFVPTRLAMLMLQVFFQWLPHHPFDDTARYLNTRNSYWPGASLILLQQHLHLLHHLWPSVPFYNYPRLHEALYPTLLINGARLEGLLPGSAPHSFAERVE
jgi:fatty acid desaturase